MKNIIFLLLIAGGIYIWIYGLPHETTLAERTDLPVKFVPAILSVPVQVPVVPPRTVQMNGYTISEVASYNVAARVLDKTNYYTGRESDLSPTDLVLGWKFMASWKVIRQLSITQGARYYNWYTSDFPIPRQEIESQSANTHIIPANTSIKQKVKGLQRGQVVTMSGYLVNVQAPDGWHWESSLTREDTGMGACEVFYVENIVVH